ncbi:MAG: hypothetical protein A2167_04100 [Planctomycetes bacterium RBG_13_46_10]|nr:MAG: hypothetical protein A2167_04100 [Planctomycetes bacterium RBG_13_46_10]
MPEKKELNCARCKKKICRESKDCFEKANMQVKLYSDKKIRKLHRAASAIEARYYKKAARLREVILFAKELGCKSVGLAFCIGLAEEAKIIEEILSRYFHVASVCCKVCGIDKKDSKLEQINPQESEVMCNPAGQAELLNEAETELNILCGLCVGHDAIFTMLSKAPVTTLITKDRVLAHNPAGAIYSNYIRNELLGKSKQNRKR